MQDNMFRSRRFFKSAKLQKGFSLIELLIVFGMSSVLFGLIVFNLIRFQNTNSQQSSADSIISDIRNQQSKAMLGATEGRVDSDSYGIYFYSDRYVLFHGSSFDPNDTSNFTVDLPDDLAIENTSFPGNTVIFEKLSGDIIGFIPGSDSLTLKAVNINRDIVITLNRYGVITGIN